MIDNVHGEAAERNIESEMCFSSTRSITICRFTTTTTTAKNLRTRSDDSCWSWATMMPATAKVVATVPMTMKKEDKKQRCHHFKFACRIRAASLSTRVVTISITTAIARVIRILHLAPSTTIAVRELVVADMQCGHSLSLYESRGRLTCLCPYTW